MDKEIKSILKKIEELEDTLYGLDINQINKKIDILYSLDILNKKILQEHENRINKLEK
jgi:hypothetical protein